MVVVAPIVQTVLLVHLLAVLAAVEMVKKTPQLVEMELQTPVVVAAAAATAVLADQV